MCQPELRPLAHIIVLAGTLLSLALPGCRQKMADMEYYRPYKKSALFEDKLSVRLPVGGTVARGQLNEGPLYTGTEGGEFITGYPFPLDMAHLKRGRERFDIYCAPCHGPTGKGNGMIVKRGFPVPPSFHSDRLKREPNGYFFGVITNGGKNTMPNYDIQIPAVDRWNIIAYIRALQLSQDRTLADVPSGQRAKLGEPPRD